MEPWIQERLDWLDAQKNPWEKVQDRDELALFLPWLKCRRPKSILEIGVRSASNFYLMAGCLQKFGTITGLDVCGKLEPYWNTVREKLSGEGINSEFVVGDSLKLAEIFEGRKFDHIYIDGNHLYIYAESDYKQALTLLAPYGTIGFHDISPIARTGEVDQLWWTLRNKRVFEEIHKIGRCGIGVIDPSLKG